MPRLSSAPGILKGGMELIRSFLCGTRHFEGGLHIQKNRTRKAFTLLDSVGFPDSKPSEKSCASGCSCDCSREQEFASDRAHQPTPEFGKASSNCEDGEYVPGFITTSARLCSVKCASVVLPSPTSSCLSVLMTQTRESLLPR